MIRNYINTLIGSIPFALLFGVIFGIGAFNITKQYFDPTINATGTTFMIATLISYIMIITVLLYNSGKQNYIELRDSHIYVCDPIVQNRLSVIKGVLLKQTDKRNKKYSWDQLLNIEICLNFSSMSGGYSGLYRIYSPELTFHFIDGYQYTIPMGRYMGEDIKTAYMIIKSKGVLVIANEEMMGYLNQNEKTIFEYFESIYHLNSKKNS